MLEVRFYQPLRPLLFVIIHHQVTLGWHGITTEVRIAFQAMISSMGTP